MRAHNRHTQNKLQKNIISDAHIHEKQQVSIECYVRETTKIIRKSLFFFVVEI